MAELVVENVSKEFPTRAEPLVVLREASLALSRGENAAVLGPSGSGKSTLLHIIGTLDTPTSGTVTLAGENPFQLGEGQLARFRNRKIGFIFQEHHLLPQLSVLENTLVPAIAGGGPSKETVGRARDLLKRVGLAKRLDHRPAELSGGEKQRVAAARALINGPALLLADEPTGSLDRTTAQLLAKLLLDLQQQENTMLLVVTHSIELADMMQRKLHIEDGKLVSEAG